MVNILVILLIAVLVSFILTGFLRRYALAKNLIDDPNERSSHIIPTPRGGGLAIVLTFLALLPFLEPFDSSSRELLWALLGAGAWVALIGFIDDHGHIPALWRVVLQFVGAGWALAWLGGLPVIPILGLSINLAWAGHLLALIYIVWLLNLYNFMDGIDGIAGVEAVTVCLSGLAIYLVSPTGSSTWMAPILLLAASVIGFLIWNFPKAKIFMGDTGSSFLGVVFGIISIQAAWVNPEMFWVWLILLGAFVTDATVTLIRRVLRSEKIYKAHRNHAYQYASRKIGRHTTVTLAFAVINLFWLLPVALLVVMDWLDGALGFIIAYIPLILLSIHFKAGAKEIQEV
jgi:Fuc2NAc and GlcNAc transferase